MSGGIDSSIYSLIQNQKPIQMGPSPFEQAGQMMQIRQLIGQNELQGLQRGELERGIREQGQIRDLFSRGNVKPEEVYAINPTIGAQFQKSAADQQAAQAKLLEQDDKLMKSFAERGKEELMAVTPEQWPAYRKLQLDRATLFSTPQFKQIAQQAMAQMPEQYDPNWVRATLAGGTPAPAGHTRLPGGGLSPADPNYVAGRSAIAAAGQQPVWDSERGIWVTPPGATFASAATPAGAPAAATPAGQNAPPRPVAAPAILPKAEMQRLEKEKERSAEVRRMLNTYVQARDGLLSGLGGATSGPLAGRIPAFTPGQQVAEGAVSAMAPVLKQLFRSAGEGTFTDRDQELLLSMVPTRADLPAARAEKMANIDRIVAAKLGMEVPAYKPKVNDDGVGVKLKPHPALGTRQRGYIYKGGDPSKPESWEKARE